MKTYTASVYCLDSVRQQLIEVVAETPGQADRVARLAYPADRYDVCFHGFGPLDTEPAPSNSRARVVRTF